MSRIINTEIQNENEKLTETTLRPNSLEKYIGQSKIKNDLKISIQSANKRNATLEHLLFYGPPGLGKTTIANIVANEMGAKIKVTSGPAIEKPGELAAILTSLPEGGILFIDEIHRLNKQVEEILYPAMEDKAIDITIGKGHEMKTLRLNLSSFTLIGATTRVGMLSAPLRDRFGIIHRLEYYSVEELKDIVISSANTLNIEITDEAAKIIAKGSRGTPRLANRLLKRVRDYALVQYDNIIDKKVAVAVLNSLNIDEYGLDSNDIRLLKTIIENFNEKPVGVNTLAAAIGEDAGTIEDVYEPYLLQNGFLIRTAKGRMVTDKAKKHLCY